MIRLAFPFIRDRFVHRLLERSGIVCLVERENLETGSRHWEVVRLVAERATTIEGRFYEAHERYPSTEQWGERGWTYTTLPDAVRKYRSLAPSKAQKGGSEAEGDPEPSPPPAKTPRRVKQAEVVVPDDRRPCERCRRVRGRILRRLNRPGKPRLCDECFERGDPPRREGRPWT
jgi:hypothetical protein